MSEIFINYRTGDGNEIAALLYQSLTRRFGEDAAFFAGESIRAGQNFAHELLTHVRRSSVLLPVIGPDWSGDRRLHDEDDWVRTEIAEALRCGVPVIPVIRGRRTDRLDAADLPSELAELAELQSLRIDSASHDRDLREIGEAVAELVPRLASRDAHRTATAPQPPGSTQNSIHDGNNGFSFQGRDIGSIGTVFSGPTGPVHSGSGAQHNHTHRPTLSGDGAAYVAGDNHGGISHRFGRAERDEADGR
ncbi:TIR domain-containing protein [Streptomyces sp. NPDC048659]|uniref:toll/interleukin-1 receptor domain-containing protein n=1 Tax=Streptomyces sp. NPDC048659 TaxID=3155489 RepID=UPI00342FD1BB